MWSRSHKPLTSWESENPLQRTCKLIHLRLASSCSRIKKRRKSKPSQHLIKQSKRLRKSEIWVPQFTNSWSWRKQWRSSWVYCPGRARCRSQTQCSTWRYFWSLNLAWLKVKLQVLGSSKSVRTSILSCTMIKLAWFSSTLTCSTSRQCSASCCAVKNSRSLICFLTILMRNTE